MSNTFTTASIGCEKCGGLICITPDQLVEGGTYACFFCGAEFTFSKEKLDAVNSDLVQVEKMFEEKKRKR